VLRMSHDELYIFPVLWLTCGCPNHIQDLFLFRNLLPGNLKVTTIALMVRKCLVMVRVESIPYCTHFKCKVRSLVTNIRPNLTLRLSPISLAVGHTSHSLISSSCMQYNIVKHALRSLLDQCWYPLTDSQYCTVIVSIDFPSLSLFESGTLATVKSSSKSRRY